VNLATADPRLLVVVGAGGAGKTTLAAALGFASAAAGRDTLVITFDPSRRLKDALGVDDAAGDAEVRVPGIDLGVGAGTLSASLLDARATFDRLIERYAPDAAARERILRNRFYRDLAGGLAGILEYMAVERLLEISRSGRYARVVLDTPPTRQALDFLEAPRRIVSFLDSGALRLGLRSWFDQRGRFRPPGVLGALGRPLESVLDQAVGLEFLRELSEFFQAFAPLYAGFRERALEVEALLQDRDTLFLLVAGPGEERVPDALFFARKLEETGHRLGPLIVNRVHPELPAPPRPAGAAESAGRELLAWLGARDRRGLEHLRSLLPPGKGPLGLPLLAREPTTPAALAAVGADLARALAAY